MLNKNKFPDIPLLVSTALLIVIGFVMIYSTASIAGLSMYNDSYFFIKKYFFYLIAGIAAFIAALFWPYKNYYKISGWGLLICAVFLIATHIPGIGVEAGGATRWINLGLFSFQPSELVKFFIILFVAQALTNKRLLVRKFWQGVFPVLIVVGAVTLLVLTQPDLGTSVVILSTTFVMMFAAGSSLWQLFILFLLGLRGITFVIAHNAYQMRRLIGFIDPWKDPLGTGFHTIQSLLAVGSGGLFGVGIAQSKQKFYYLPQQFTDFIFAILCEEGGFILAFFTIILFFVFVVRGFRIALNCSDLYARLLAVGCTFCIGIQAVINIMVVTGMSPTKGIPLPFISYGGSSLVVTMFMTGLLVQLSMLGSEKKQIN